MAQNYHRAKLRGKSFKGQNLTGADFSYSDIRGADFTDAILKGVKFNHVKAGLQRRWAIALIILSLLLSAISGLLSTVGASLIGFILVNGDRYSLYVGVISLIILSVFFLIAINRGMAAAFGLLLVVVILAGIAAVAWAGIIAVAWAGIATETAVMELAKVVAVIATGAVAVIVAATGLMIIAVTVVLARTVAGTVAVVITVLVAGAIAGVVAITAAQVGLVPGGIATVVSVLMVVLSAKIGFSALLEDNKQSWVRNIALALVTRYGTRFYGADLTDADFTQASLKNTNFIQAILIRTCWFQAKKLHLAAVRKTYLENLQMRQLLVTKDLQNKNLDGWNLQRINLQGANLKDASLIATQLHESNLQSADLSRAKLVQSQLDKTDFRGAILTGAYIQDWCITPETKLDGVQCEYIFMRIPTQQDPNPLRQPANWEETFQDGEFAEFILSFAF